VAETALDFCSHISFRNLLAILRDVVLNGHVMRLYAPELLDDAHAGALVPAREGESWAVDCLRFYHALGDEALLHLVVLLTVHRLHSGAVPPGEIERRVLE